MFGECRFGLESLVYRSICGADVRISFRRLEMGCGGFVALDEESFFSAPVLWCIGPKCW